MQKFPKLNFFIYRILITLIGIGGTVTLSPVLDLAFSWYHLSEIIQVDLFYYSIAMVFMVIIMFFLLKKLKHEYIASFLFSGIYFFAFPTSIMELMYGNESDGQAVFLLFPIYIIASIALFFLLNFYKKDFKEDKA